MATRTVVTSRDVRLRLMSTQFTLAITIVKCPEIVVHKDLLEIKLLQSN
jgi:hypothetical protein